MAAMKEYDHVKIKASDLTGIIVDSSHGRFTVECDLEESELTPEQKRLRNDANCYPGRWPLFTCTEAELERIE